MKALLVNSGPLSVLTAAGVTLEQRGLFQQPRHVVPADAVVHRVVHSLMAEVVDHGKPVWVGPRPVTGSNCCSAAVPVGQLRVDTGSKGPVRSLEERGNSMKP